MLPWSLPGWGGVGSILRFYMDGNQKQTRILEPA